MNSLFQKTIALLSLATTLSLVSCQDKDLITPERSGLSLTPTLQKPDAASLGMTLKKYILTTHGPAILTCLSDGQIQKVTYQPGSAPYDYTNYSYSFLQVKTTSYSGNKVVEEHTYRTDISTGLCYESNEKQYVFYSFGTVVNEQNWVYSYNGAGQLTSRARKDAPLARTAYTYNADGDLTNVIIYDANGVASINATFSYDPSIGGAKLIDRYPLNPEHASLPNRYLTIFGKPSKHLVRRINKYTLPLTISSTLLLDNSYFYTINADGYVTEQKEYKTGIALLRTTPYGYRETRTQP